LLYRIIGGLMDFSHGYLLAVTALAIYMVGISLLTTWVNYPLYASVPPAAFVGYHARYQRLITPVIIVPGFPTFLGCVAFTLVRPASVPLWLALLVTLGGLVSLGTTFAGAIPSHVRLQRQGFDAVPYRRLRLADAFRTSACVLSAGGLIIGVLYAFTPAG
jgi:hypothetical protein